MRFQRSGGGPAIAIQPGSLSDDTVAQMEIDGKKLEPSSFAEFKKRFLHSYLDIATEKQKLDLGPVEVMLKNFKEQTSQYIGYLSSIPSSSIYINTTDTSPPLTPEEEKLNSQFDPLQGTVMGLLNPFSLYCTVRDNPALLNPMIEQILGFDPSTVTEAEEADVLNARFKAGLVWEDPVAIAARANLCLLAAIDLRLDEIARIKEEAKASKPKRGVQGRNKNSEVDSFITTFAEFYNKNGGKLPSANGQSRMRCGSFARFMKQVNALLPEELQVAEGSLEGAIRRVLARAK
jgi:hypothetical protein